MSPEVSSRPGSRGYPERYTHTHGHRTENPLSNIGYHLVLISINTSARKIEDNTPQSAHIIQQLSLFLTNSTLDVCAYIGGKFPTCIALSTLWTDGGEVQLNQRAIYTVLYSRAFFLQNLLVWPRLLNAIFANIYIFFYFKWVRNNFFLEIICTLIAVICEALLHIRLGPQLIPQKS